MYKKISIILILAACITYSIKVYSLRNPCTNALFQVSTGDTLVGAKIHPGLKSMPRSMDCKVWVNFKDKPLSENFDASQAVKISSKARQRRVRRAEYDKPDFTDLPVSKSYVDKVLSIGGKHRATSRYLNAISIEVSIDKLEEIARFEFVDSIEPVMTYIQKTKKSRYYSAPVVEHKKIQYGESYKQVEQIKADALHKKGYHGEGILVGLLDTGFDLSHKAIIDTDVVGEHDFIYDDENCANQSNQDDDVQDNHGTFVLSVIAANAPGHLISPAFSASYLLGKTEKVSENGEFFEKRIEEDWWIEGIEWMESQGVDVVNSSLGYNDWYKFPDLDGNTAKITKAANLAVKKGVVVVIANGNLGSNKSNELGLQGHITPPADGFDVLAVGAVDDDGKIASFSSRGPTYDGRIKPDLMAMGENTVVADAETENAYTRINGTSVASPLIAGIAALLLQAFPNAKAKQIVEALRKTGSRADSPNNDYGWGIANAQAAYDYLLEQMASSEATVAVATSDMNTINSRWAKIKSEFFDFSLGQNYPNPSNPETWIPFKLGHAADVSLIIYDMQGRLVREIELGYLPADVYVDRDKAVHWNGVNEHGEKAASGQYFYQLKVGDFTATRKMLIIK